MKVTDRKPESRVLILGHRGSPTKEIENTISSFRRAIADGADGIELDIHLTKDDKLVVIHDFTTTRVFGIDREVEDLTLQELKEISPEIPSLEEVFEAMGPIYYDIELKAEFSIDKNLVLELLKLLDKYPSFQNKIMLSSFNPIIMRILANNTKSKYPLGIIYDGPPTTLPFFLRKGEGRLFFKADYLKPKWDIAAREKTKKSKYPIIPWTVDKKETLLEMVALKAPVIITNEPGLMVKALQEEGLR